MLLNPVGDCDLTAPVDGFIEYNLGPDIPPGIKTESDSLSYSIEILKPKPMFTKFSSVVFVTSTIASDNLMAVKVP